MSKKYISTEAIRNFRNSLKELLLAHDSIGKYRTFVFLVKDKVKIKNRKISQSLEEILSKESEGFLANLIFVNLVTIMEVYLKECLFEALRRDPKLVRRFLEKYKMERRISVDDLYVGANAFAFSLLNDIVFHNLKKVDALYKIVFNFSILELGDYKNLEKCVKIRHNIVHENSQVDGKKMEFKYSGILGAAKVILNFVEGIDYFIRHRKKRKKFTSIFSLYSGVTTSLAEWDEYLKAKYIISVK